MAASARCCGEDQTNTRAWGRRLLSLGWRSEFARHVERRHGEIVVRVGAISALRFVREVSQAVHFCAVPIVNAKVPMPHDVAPLKSGAKIKSIGWWGLGVTRTPTKQV